LRLTETQDRRPLANIFVDAHRDDGKRFVAGRKWKPDGVCGIGSVDRPRYGSRSSDTTAMLTRGTNGNKIVNPTDVA